MNDYVIVVFIIPLVPKEFQQVELDLSLDGAWARMVDGQNRVEFFQGLQIHASYKRTGFPISNSPNR